MGLFKPIWMTANIKKEARAVQKIKRHDFNSPQKLLAIVKTAPLLGVRCAAAGDIGDEQTLIQIVQDDTMHELVRYNAAQRINSLEAVDHLEQHFYTSEIHAALGKIRARLLDNLLWDIERNSNESQKVERAERAIRYSRYSRDAERAYAFLPFGYPSEKLKELDTYKNLGQYYDPEVQQYLEAEKQRTAQFSQDSRYLDACSRDGI